MRDSLSVGNTWNTFYAKIVLVDEGGSVMDQKKIGDFIAALRKEAGMTQQELGKIMVLPIRPYLVGKTETTCRILY